MMMRGEHPGNLAEADFVAPEPEPKKAGKVSGGDVRDSDPRTEARDWLIEEFERQGLFERDASGRMVADVDQLRATNLNAILKQRDAFLQARTGGSLKTGEVIPALLGDFKIVSKEEAASGKREHRIPQPKPLTYVPENPKAAFSSRAIAQNDFHLGPWELGSQSHRHYEGVTLPTKDGQGVDMREASIAALIYHPKYGNARRDEDGTLLVYWPSRQEFRPISSDWFRKEMKQIFSVTSSGKAVSLNSPANYLKQHGRSLVQEGLLTPDDFRLTATGQEFSPREQTITRGAVMIDGVSYYLGKGPTFEGSKVLRISDHEAAIIREDQLGGQKSISHTFTLFTPKQREALPVHTVSKGGVVHRRTNKGDVDLKPYAPSEHDDVDFLLQLSERLGREAGVNIFLLDATDQWTISRAAAEMRRQPERFINFVRLYGQDGLTALTTSKFDPTATERVLSIGEMFAKNPAPAQAMFHAQRDFSTATKGTAEEFADAYKNFSGEDIDALGIEQALLSHGNDLFVEVVTMLRESEPSAADEIMDAMTADFRRSQGKYRSAVGRFIDIGESLKRGRSASDDRTKFKLAEAFRQTVFGERAVELERGFMDDLPDRIKELKPEQLPEFEPVYFPVGISKDLPRWKEVLEGNLESAKPVELYGFLFWLQNQTRQIEIVVCDEMQVNNARQLYPELFKDGDESVRELTRSIGRAEAENYSRIIETFHLTNVRVTQYAEFRDRNKVEFDQARERCERLADHPLFQKAIEEMVQESVGQATSPEEKRRYRAYALEELAWILSTEGTKISHVNEARYDVVATLIRACDSYAQEHGKTFEDLERDGQLAGVVRAASNELRSRLNGKNSRQPEGSLAKEYYARSLKMLGLLNPPAVPPSDFRSNLVRNETVIPETGAASFGWRSRGASDEAVIKFREPYSTYFYERGTEPFLTSDQIVALPHGELSGKVLALPAEAQRQYAQRVLKPMLTHFFKATETNLPGSGEQLLKEAQGCTTISELLGFVQKNIIRPTTQ